MNQVVFFSQKNNLQKLFAYLSSSLLIKNFKLFDAVLFLSQYSETFPLIRKGVGGGGGTLTPQQLAVCSCIWSPQVRIMICKHMIPPTPPTPYPFPTKLPSITSTEPEFLNF
jgi:hypothetical protein